MSKPRKRKKKKMVPIEVPEDIVDKPLLVTADEPIEIVATDLAPPATPLSKDELKELKKTLRKLIAEKPVLPYPEESKLQPWLKQLEAAVK